jgi:hypothetical protein
MAGDGTRGPARRRPRTQQGSTLSVQRAFVVHFGADDRPGRRRFRGRVEHLPSGDSTTFASLKELLAFFAAVLDATSPALIRKGEHR